VATGSETQTKTFTDTEALSAEPSARIGLAAGAVNDTHAGSIS